MYAFFFQFRKASAKKKKHRRMKTKKQAKRKYIENLKKIKQLKR